MEGLALGFILFAIIITIAGYFVPSLIAFHYNAPNKLFILLVNIVIGWTIIGWVGAFLWAILEHDGTNTIQLIRESL